MLFLLVPAVLAAQAGTPLVLSGRLVLAVGSDTTSLASHFVTAHRVSMTEQGPSDSVRTDAAGRFRFRITAPESATVYVVSAQYSGIGYFSEPFSGTERDGAAAITLVVHDTAMVGPPLHVAIRHLVVERIGTGGDRRVLDLIQIVNPDSRTRVAADSLASVWSARIPLGVLSPSVGPGELPESAVRFSDGRVEVAAAFPPGQKQIVLTYMLPSSVRELAVPIDQPTARFEVIMEGDAVPEGGLQAGEPLNIEGRSFTRFSASALAPGTQPQVRFSGGAGGDRTMMLVVVLAAALALGAGALVFARRGAAEGAAAAAAPAEGTGRETGPSQQELVAAIVSLDERYEGRGGEVSPEEWADYTGRRAELKSQLAARVAQP